MIAPPRALAALAIAIAACGSTVADGGADTTTGGPTSSSGSTPDESSGIPESSGPAESTDTSSAGSSGESTGTAPACGDGVLDGLEQCDDGNDTPDDGCEPGCLLASGELVWAIDVDGGDDDVAYDLVVGDDGDLVVVGSRRGDGGLDTWIAVYDPAGELRDEHVIDFGEGDDDEALAIARLGLGWVLVGVASPVGDDLDDALLLAVDGDFATVWSRRIDGGLDDRANAVAIAPSAIAIAGHREGVDSFEDAWYAVYDTSGTEQWSRADDGPGSRNDDARGVAWLADGGLVVVGHQAVDSQDDLWITARDGDGNQRFEELLDFEFGDDAAVAVVADGDEFVVTGSISSALTNSEEVWVARFAADGTPGTVISYNSPGFVFDGGEDSVLATIEREPTVFVAGIAAAADEQRNALVGRWPAAGGEPVWHTAFDGGPGLNDAAHAIAVLGDGSVVAAGEVTVLGQGTNAWIRRWAP